MANGVNIPIVVTANTAGAQQATTALQGVGTAAQQAGQAIAPAAGNPWITASRGLSQVQQQAQQAAPAVASVGAAAQQAAGNNRAQGLLLLGQALEDAQYGLRGVMNNIPGLVMSFGLGAGAAGVLQIALVAVSQVMNMLKADAEEGVDWSKMTPSEELEARIQAVTDQLRQQAAALDALSEARDRAVQADKSWLAHQEEMARLTGQDEDPKKVSELFEEREKLRESEVAAAEESTAAAQEQAKAVADAAAAQEDRVQRLEELPKLHDQEREQMEKVQKIQDSLEADDRRNYLSPDERAAAEDFLAQEQAKLRQTRQRIREAPELEGVGPDASEEERRNALNTEREAAENLRRQADAAAKKAADEQAELDRTRQETRQQSEQDAVRTTQKLEEMTGLTPLPNAETGRSPLLEPGLRPLLTPKPDETPAEAEPAPEAPPPDAGQTQKAGNEAITQAVAGLDDLSQQAQSDQMRTAIAELRATLTDRDGATAADVQRIQQFLGSLQTSNSEAQRAIAGTISSMAQAMQSFVGEINSLRVQVDQLRTSANSMR